MSDPIGFNLNSPPTEAIDYLKAKGYAISFDYDELMHDAHHRAFTVAKVMQLDLLADIHQSLLDAQAKGTPFEQWKKDLIPTLKAKQWWGEKEIYDERTGEYKTIRIDGNRLKTIFVTNINTSYEVGRCRQMAQLPPEFAYLRYWAIKDAKSRPRHAALHGLILPKSDHWWDINRPKNGWRCRCTVQALTLDMIEAKGYKIADKAPPRIADADWGFNPCKDSAANLDKAYFNKVQSLVCPENNARTRDVLCPFVDSVKHNYKTAMLATLPTPEKWGEFVDKAITEPYNHSERLGFLSMIEPLQDWLSIVKPESDLIQVDTAAIRNLLAKGIYTAGAKPQTDTQKPTFTPLELKNLINVIHQPDEIYFDNYLILVWNLSDGKGKLVIEIDNGDKKAIYHTLKSGMVYSEEGFKQNVKDMQRIY